MTDTPPLAVVTGASSGIGFELARQFAERGYDVVIAAEDAAIDVAAESLRRSGARVRPLRIDLRRAEGRRRLAAHESDGPGQPPRSRCAESRSGTNHLGALIVGRYAALDLPRTTTTAGAALLLGLDGVHLYMLVREDALPTYLGGGFAIPIGVSRTASGASGRAPGAEQPATARTAAAGTGYRRSARVRRPGPATSNAVAPTGRRCR
ncbi:SDR family NAD(P)-dependent oxidoreductase [Nocardia mikamii]|uniref:SDR family NAD(P)-dependent oxidoreductase n=1 Tax=Nocardia mikamii TaxID=508464 RepID=UPI0007A4E31D|nr:SDR family NAD(P)-dependent oxidoreductase [Nocardia mikamii]